MSSPLWGIDLGGTKLEGVILSSLNDPRPITRIRIDTERQNGYEYILDRIHQLVELMKNKSGLSPEMIGFGTPGVLDPVSQTMKNCNSTVLNGKPLQKDLERKLRLGVRLANDANCFALAETHWGIVKQKYPGAELVFGIIMGTGVGGGIVHGGVIWGGKHGIGGEWGHNYLDQSGGPCYCGQQGCVETVLSGPALESFYFKNSGVRKPLQEIVALHQAQTDPVATETINRLHNFFGKALSVVINILDPDLIVVGGGVGNIDSLYTDGVNSLKNFIFNNRLDVPVERPILGDSAGVFGAAALAVGSGRDK